MILYTTKKEVVYMELGDIVYFKNIIFKNDDGSHELDPYFSIGRPCVCIGEYEDYMYFLPLTRIDDRRDEKFFDIIVKPNKQNGLKKISKINYTNIIKKPISFFKVEGKISQKEILEILKKSLTLYNCEQYDYSDIVSKIMADYVKKENIVLLEKKNKGENLEKENLSIGDIVLIKQIVFSNDERAEADHSFGSGRPCMFAGSKNGKMYFFPLSGYKPKNKDYLFLLNPNEENGLKKVSGIRANKILEMPYQSFQTVGFISEKKVLNIIKSFILYYHNNYETLSERHIYDTVFYIFNNKVKSEKNLKKLKK